MIFVKYTILPIICCTISKESSYTLYPGKIFPAFWIIVSRKSEVIIVSGSDTVYTNVADTTMLPLSNLTFVTSHPQIGDSYQYK